MSIPKFDNVLKAIGGSNSSTQVVVAPLDDASISMIVEMGFSRERVDNPLEMIIQTM